MERAMRKALGRQSLESFLQSVERNPEELEHYVACCRQTPHTSDPSPLASPRRLPMEPELPGLLTAKPCFLLKTKSHGIGIVSL
mmetsp:Transcript_37641/g.89938  ORF Transcript_37641/g.89938 Transcript_37641/m.89938 type:complete len:84 (+) Transcript_37641:52-303(+)